MENIDYFIKKISDKNLLLYITKTIPQLSIKPGSKRTDINIDFLRYFSEIASESEQAQIEYDCYRIRELSKSDGIDTLISTWDTKGLPTVDEIFEKETEYNQAFWFYYNHPKMFSRAHIWYIAEHKSGWREVYFPAGIKAETIKSREKDFIEAFKKHLHSEERKAGKNCAIDVYEQDERVCFVAFPEGRAIENRFYEKGDLQTKGVRKEVKERYFVYNTKTGLLRVKMRDYHKSAGMQKLFGAVVLGRKWEEATVKVLNLSALQDPNIRLELEREDYMESVKLLGLSIVIKDTGRRISLTMDRAKDHGVRNLHEFASEHNIPISSKKTEIIWVKMEFKFKPDHYKGTKSKTLALTGINLTELSDDHIDRKIRELLLRWNIITEQDEKPSETDSPSS